MPVLPAVELAALDRVQRCVTCQEVEQYRAIAGDSKVLLLELQGRCQELNVDGTLKARHDLQSNLNLSNFAQQSLLLENEAAQDRAGSNLRLGRNQTLCF